MPWALLMLLAGSPIQVTHRDIAMEMQLRCEKEGFVDVRDFGGCGVGDLRGVPVDEAEAVKNAERFARECIPGRVLPVRYCPAKPNS